MCRIIVILGVCAASFGCRKQNDLPPALGAENIPVTFVTDNGWEYDGRIELPSVGERNGWAVMMIGGGLGSPIDWEAPGDSTLDGQPVRSGDTIAKALLEAGFVVMRWHAIRRGDALYAMDGIEMEATTFPQTAEQARRAFAAFREKKVVADDHIFLLGHSLGAKRAALLMEANPETAGVVLLAGAALVPTHLDDLKSGVAGVGDDTADRHEAAVALLGREKNQWFSASVGPTDKNGFRWAVDILSNRRTPVLAIAGTADEPALLDSYVLTLHLRERGHPAYTWRVYERLGHYLDRRPQTDDKIKQREYAKRVGPMDEQVVKDIVAWLRDRIR